MFAEKKMFDVSSSSMKSSSPWVMLTFNQQYQSMLNVTGQTQTASQKAEFELRSGALAGSDGVDGINGPMMIAATSLAGEVCNGLIIKEKASSQRRFFSGVDFNQTLKNHSPDTFMKVASTMAGNFYARQLREDETKELTDFYKEFVTGAGTADATQLKNVYLSLCSAMLSSFDSMTY